MWIRTQGADKEQRHSISRGFGRPRKVPPTCGANGEALPPRTKITLGPKGRRVFIEPKYVNGEVLTYAN